MGRDTVLGLTWSGCEKGCGQDKYRNGRGISGPGLGSIEFFNSPTPGPNEKDLGRGCEGRKPQHFSWQYSFERRKRQEPGKT